ncbi:MAG: DUF5681 domain-containing protein [Candidatus Acidiferrales bacterium]
MAGKGRIQNLRPPWKPGESGNPSGRPKNRPISDFYAEVAQRPVPEKLRRTLGLARGATFAEAQTVSLFIAASNGDVRAAREIREGIEGKANERSKIEHRGFDINISYEDPPKAIQNTTPEASQDTTPKASQDTTPGTSPDTTEK